MLSSEGLLVSASKDTGGKRRSAAAAEPVLPPARTSTLDLVAVLSSVQETAYQWDVASDRRVWAVNAQDVLRVSRLSDIATDSAFQMLIAPEHAGRRRAAMVSDAPAGGNGIPFRVQYQFHPDGHCGGRALWLEDHGRWWPGPDGRPARAQGVLRVLTDRHQEEQRLLFRSDHDELTGQLNRIRLSEALGAILARAERAEQPCVFLMASVDHLAVINETFGFDVGDELLTATAHAIKGQLRASDTIGRYSSNKFGIVLPDCGLAAMRIAAERLMLAVRETTITTSTCQLPATISIGGVLLTEQKSTVQHALSSALHALGRAKDKGHDRFMIHEASPSQESQRKRNGAIADQIMTALAENRLLLALQPVVHTATRKPGFYECLLRLQQPDGRRVPASEFIEVAEQLRLARLIDRRTLELAIDLLKGRPDVSLSLNVSGLTAGDSDWLVALRGLTGGRRQLTGRLIIEITETAAVRDLVQTMTFVDAVKDIGCRVAIDDFGAGHTSFKNLKLLDVDMVKIDGTFVSNLATDARDRLFVKALKELADGLGLETVAEWVKDEESAGILAGIGITYLQGYLFGEPLMPDDLPPPDTA